MIDVQETIAAHWPFREKPLRRVVVKAGSNVLSLPKGGLDPGRMHALCASLAAARRNGLEVILVSSGAVAAGRGILGLTKRPTSIPDLQAVAAIGQGALMEEYNRHLRGFGFVGAQMLLNREDMDDRRRYLNARLALASMLQHDVIPIINENDTVNIDELKFGDNDMLSAMVAAKMEADLLVILSNVPGLMTGNPSTDPTAEIVPVVSEVDGTIESLVHSEKSGLGTGGMATKLKAASHGTRFGVTVVITNGMNTGQLDTVLSGKFQGTLFLPPHARRAGDSRRHWIGSHSPSGLVVVDEGAARALSLGGRSLLPVGIRGVKGAFQAGDVVRIEDEHGKGIAQGIANYDSDSLTKIIGKRGEEILTLLGEAAYEEAIHRNNMVLVKG